MNGLSIARNRNRLANFTSSPGGTDFARSQSAYATATISIPTGSSRRVSSRSSPQPGVGE